MTERTKGEKSMPQIRVRRTHQGDTGHQEQCKEDTGEKFKNSLLSPLIPFLSPVVSIARSPEVCCL